MSFITNLKMRIHKLRKKRDLNLCMMCPDDVRGLCCYTSGLYTDNGKQYNIIYDKHSCPYLDKKAGLCTVFETRFTTRPQCLEIGKAIKHNALPADCLYVKNNRKYRERLPKVKMEKVKDQFKEKLEIRDKDTGKIVDIPMKHMLKDGVCIMCGKTETKESKSENCVPKKVYANWNLKNESRW